MAGYDVIVIGSGLAGLTAGLFSARQGLSTLVMESNIPGGHLISIEKIEDFPGFPDAVSGYEICPNLQRQAADNGAEFCRAEVLRLEAATNRWSVVTEEETHYAQAVIVATGSTLKHLGVPGEEKLMGRGVSHCASCDGPLYNGQIVGIVGGGDSALQEALTLAQYAERVWLFHREEQFSAQATYQQRVLSNGKITPRFRVAIEAILGDDVVTGVSLRDLPSGALSQVELAGVFVYAGLQPNTALLGDWVDLNQNGQVPTDNWLKTARDGLYAVGDIRQDSARQAITAAGDGATAAVAAYRYIKAIGAE
jgi:thioredoxin reductase (NADPH)